MSDRQSEELFAAYSKLNLAHANEAETRLKLIDRVLFEVLGWTHEDVNVEERISEDGKNTYIDYILKTATSALVVEAKRVGEASYDVPNTRRAKLQGRLLQGALGEAIKQARDYCRRASIQFAVVTDGSHWVVFPANRIDRVAFSDSSAVIFPGLQSALRDDFQEFYSLLSREAVIAGSLEVELLGRNSDQSGERRLRNQFTNVSLPSGHNPLFPLIEDELNIALTDAILDRDPSLLEKCYVNTTERVKFDREIRMRISRQRPVVNSSAFRPLARKGGRPIADVLAGAEGKARPLAILVLGRVGAGKTTFLQHTRLVSTREYFATPDEGVSPHWIYLDFRAFDGTVEIGEFVYRLIQQYLDESEFFSNYEQCIRPAYIDQIRSITSSLGSLIKDKDRVNERIADHILGQRGRPEYVDRMLGYVGTKKPVFLVVDNVDQIEAAEIQTEIFATAIAFAHRTGLNLVLCLRDSTYVQHRASPTFDAFDFSAVYIDPPPIEAVLSKRFFLLEQLLKGKRVSFTAENGAKVQLNDAAVIARLITSSVLGTQVGRTIEVLATSNVRLALRMTREFLESGYSNPGRAIQTYQRTGSYVLPPHEALRAVMLGKHAVYQEEFSIIANPFDAKLSRTDVQMIRAFVLSALVTSASRSDFQYMEGEEIRGNLQKIGVSDDVSLRVLQDLCKHRWLHTASHGQASFSASFYPSVLGGYILRKLLPDMVFLEATMMDTYVSDRDAWDELKELSIQISRERDIVKRVGLRVRRARRFFDYTTGQYQPLLIEAQKRGLSAEWCEDPFRNASHTLERNLQRIVTSARRNYGRTEKA